MDKTDLGLNESYVEMMRAQWKLDVSEVSDDWRRFFESEGKGTLQDAKIRITEPLNTTIKGADLPASRDSNESPLVGVAKKIVENMELSLSIPTAMSSRTMPVKVLEENRLVINEYLVNDARQKCSFTHLIGYAIVRAVMAHPVMNCAFVRDDQGKIFRSHRTDINLGIAIDVPGRNGLRSLVVPNIKKCQDLDFWSFFNAFNECVDKAKRGKLTMDDFNGTTLSLTNPGGIGTQTSSPRLMVNQSAIIATGTIGYPPEYEATAPETLHSLGIGKVMTVTSTYDHRVIQGAESGAFLDTLHKLITGQDGFFDEVFRAIKIPYKAFTQKADRAVVFGFDSVASQTERAMRVSQMIHAYRVRGYLVVHSDPLSLAVPQHVELDLQHYSLTIWDLDREFDTLGLLPKKRAVLRDILTALRRTYCQRMGVEYMYISDFEQKKWIQERVERQTPTFTIDEKKDILRKLVQAESFEHFLHKRFVGHKRFSIEGAESTICALTELLRCAASFGVTDVVLGMSHRGRLNVLANIVGKPYEAIFAEFDDIDPKTFHGTGDVKYHLGAKGVYRWKGVPAGSDRIDERIVRLQLACNPSHLESVNPVVEGQVRARQDMAGDRERNRVIPVLLHGDAAFAAQGVVYETMQLSNLQGYRTGGTIHFVINNQIGYTTPPEKARSSVNCSDIARALSVPVFRVNGDDPESCLNAIRLAFEYRMRFNRDAVIDMVCYRRHGHNEGDEPSFTQPILYQAIQKHDSVAKIYSEYLFRRSELAVEELQSIEKEFHDKFEKALDAVRKLGHDAVTKEHLLFEQSEDTAMIPPQTFVARETLEEITRKVTFDPQTIKIHPRIETQVLQRRYKMVFEGNPGIDFGMAEILAYGSLQLEGIPIRISGQDCGRGTFAHRHAVLYDVEDGSPYIPLNHLERTIDEGETPWNPSRFRIYDSPLSEAGVVGFEYGYSVSHPSSLVIWEAQFGDFFNGAQVQVDQLISSAETKWGQKSGLTMFLPHGYDGQGPEHSSSRIERFLQLCAENNMRVCICSTSAQQFHLLRLQAKLPKKPLILGTHKSLLRADFASSPIEDFSSGSFKMVIDDNRKKTRSTKKRLILCCGKVYWDVVNEREKRKDAAHVYVVRIEQLYPFPLTEIIDLIKLYAARDLVWLQEEPKNQGAYHFVADNLRDAGFEPRYIGRLPAASPATGSPKTHKKQQASIVDQALEALS